MTLAEHCRSGFAGLNMFVLDGMNEKREVGDAVDERRVITSPTKPLPQETIDPTLRDCRKGTH
jgi:hypothetical protein